MAGYRALAAVGRSLVNLLNRRFAEEIPVGPRPRAVLAGTTDFDQVNSNPMPVIQMPGLSVYCYRISVDRETRPGWSAVASRTGVPCIPLRMHLMISAWDTVVESELEWLGLAAKVIESEAGVGDQKEVKILIEFMRTAKRGVVLKRRKRVADHDE